MPTTKPDTTLSMADYVEGKGNFCPLCGSDLIDRGNAMFPEVGDEGTALNEGECHSCKGEWTEIWCLVGYEQGGNRDE